MESFHQLNPQIKLLYVEDDPATRETITSIISRRFPSLSIRSAENGQAGLDSFQECRADLILTDINMPIMDGIEMACKIKALAPSVAIIAATAFSDTHYLMDAIKVGITRYVLKPVNFGLLFEAIDGCISRIVMERQLKEQDGSIRKLSRAIEQSPSMVMITDTAGAIEYVNSRFSTITGYLPEEVIGQNLREVMTRASPLDTFEQIWSTITGGSEWRGEILNRKKDGELYCEELSISPLACEDGEMTHFVAVMEDISRSKKLEQGLHYSEEQFRTLCEVAPIGIFRTDREGNIIYLNPHGEKIPGLAAPKATVKGSLSGVHPDDRERHTAAWLEAVATGELSPLEHRLLTPEGETTWVRAMASSIKGTDGQIAGFVGTMENVTELLQARQEMLKTQKLESLGVLAGGIAHDFNNILTGVIGNISLAQFELHDPEKLAKRLEHAERSAVRAKDLTRQLLTFARGGEPVRKIVKVPDLLREAVKSTLRGSNVKCEFEFANDLWPLEVDEGQLAQVIQNLALNALQAMPEGGTITLGATNVLSQQGSRFVTISLADTGGGIPDYQLAKIFDPYFTTKQSGSGLGLATCYSIIRKHGGKIRATSSLGAGSCFKISLPAAFQSCEAKPSSPLAAVSDVLVMDDDEEVRKVTKSILEQFGYTVECAENGEEAIERYRQRKGEGKTFSAVILDLTVPGGIGGKETIKKLLEIDPDVKAIVSSGYSNDPVMADYRGYGFRAVLKKPYLPGEIRNVLQELQMS